jgi:two-component system sensor histidine kinase KdpD
VTTRVLTEIETALHRGAAVRGPRRHVAAILSSAAAVTVATLAIALIKELAPVVSLGIVYVFAVLPIALAFGLGYSVVVSVASMLAFNWFFLPPVHSFTLSDSRNWVVLAVFVVTAVVVSLQAARSRARAVAAEQRELETATIARLATSLLRGGTVTDRLGELSLDTAAVLGANKARIELGQPHPAPAGESPLPLTVDGRAIGTVYLDDRAAPSLSARQRFLPALASLLAVTSDREQLSERAVEADTLRRSDTVKTAVLRAVSHDLRTPITAIRMAVDTLRNTSYQLSDGDRAGLLDTIHIETERLSRLVSNLLDLSRLEAGAAVPVAELWPPEALVAQAIGGMGHDADRVDVRVAADLPPVRVDPIHAQRMLVNLLENALRYSPPTEPVLVTGTSTRREVILRVVDHGSGIPVPELGRIFEPFYHDGQSPTGAGLGLAIARGFAEANGGRVWAESEAGQGTSLALALPVG